MFVCICIYIDTYIHIVGAQIDAIAAKVQQRIQGRYEREGGGAGAGWVEDAVKDMNFVLFEELGFCGNEQNYYDPGNSYLHVVLERKTGIPISLSVRARVLVCVCVCVYVCV